MTRRFNLPIVGEVELGNHSQTFEAQTRIGTCEACVELVVDDPQTLDGETISKVEDVLTNPGNFVSAALEKISENQEIYTEVSGRIEQTEHPQSQQISKLQGTAEKLTELLFSILPNLPTQFVTLQFGIPNRDDFQVVVFMDADARVVDIVLD